jgi:hypothetical protein
LWPTRQEVEQRWLDVLQQRVPREEAHAWAVPWVEGTPEAPCPDLMVGLGLTYLHGFDTTNDPEAPHLSRHGGPGVYAKSLEDVREDLEYWRSNCADYDRGPDDWKVRRVAAARAWVVKERQRRAAGPGCGDG